MKIWQAAHFGPVFAKKKCFDVESWKFAHLNWNQEASPGGECWPSTKTLPRWLKSGQMIKKWTSDQKVVK